MSDKKEYWIEVGKRIIDMVLSVKVLCVISLITISTIALFTGKMDGTIWATFNGSFITAVVATREVFKIYRIGAINNEVADVERRLEKANTEAEREDVDIFQEKIFREIKSPHSIWKI